jgi:uncharacterized repeat protein (TIGR01451 family)
MAFQPSRVARLASAALFTVWALAGPAWALGSLADTPISNTAQATFNDPDGNPQTVISNTVSLRVDEVLNVTIVSNDAGNVSVFSPDDDDPLSFTVGNPGNGPEAYTLTPNPNLGGDDYDPTDTRIFLDDGDGVFEPGQDTLYSPGVNDPVIAPDTTIVVFVVNDTPAGQATGDTGSVSITASAVTVTGSNLPGTVYPGDGTNGVDAVVGITTATASSQGTYAVVQALATLVKTHSVLDPFNGSTYVPGAVITYTLTLTLQGTGTITGAQIDDLIPNFTTYVPNSMHLDGNPTALTDAADADEGEFTGTGIVVTLGSVTAPATHTVDFQVQID